MILEESYTLANGVEIPKLGLGTWFISNEDVIGAVKEAARLGYRHVDTAQAYRNERGVGEGVRASGVQREHMFVTTKLAAEVKDFKKAVRSIDTSLKDLGLDYIDMMIIHSPQPWRHFREGDRHLEGNREAWRALEEAYAAGKLRAIGVSNFEQEDIDNILASCSVRPMVNQILAHIGNVPTELIRYCEANGLLVEAYSPIAHGVMLKNQDVAEIAERYRVSIPQLCIRYDLQLGLLPLPKTARAEHMKTNADVDFEISAEDMHALDSVAPITDYGRAGMMPVFGGKLSLRGVASSLLRSGRD
ncbi:MAG: aldo/keto reductase [Thermoleophilia bacterium]|mgnify:FL=1